VDNSFCNSVALINRINSRIVGKQESGPISSGLLVIRELIIRRLAIRSMLTLPIRTHGACLRFPAVILSTNGTSANAGFN
jgi:hypothetical protein